MVEGVQRARLVDLDESAGGFTATVETLRITYPLSDKLQVYMGKVLSTFEHYAKVSRGETGCAPGCWIGYAVFQYSPPAR